MTITIVAVHPAVVVVSADDRQLEFPITWFPRPPRVGQKWQISLDHEPTEEEKIGDLNELLPRLP